MKRKIGERGQITLPKDLREQFGFLPDSEVYISEEGGRVVIEKEESSFVDWAQEISGRIGKLDKDVKSYRREQIERRVAP